MPFMKFKLRSTRFKKRSAREIFFPEPATHVKKKKLVSFVTPYKDIPRVRVFVSYALIVQTP